MAAVSQYCLAVKETAARACHLSLQADECMAGLESPERMLTQHSAWEMFDEDDAEADMLAGAPELDAAIGARAASVVEACLQNPAYSLFAAAPEPDECFPTSDGGGVYPLLPTHPALYTPSSYNDTAHHGALSSSAAIYPSTHHPAMSDFTCIKPANRDGQVHWATSTSSKGRMLVATEPWTLPSLSKHPMQEACCSTTRSWSCPCHCSSSRRGCSIATIASQMP